MRKHTKGPWQVLPKEDGKEYLRVRGTRLGSRFKIANVHCLSYGDGYDALDEREEEETQANAALIAAAPDLMEAARMVIEWFEAEDDHSKADFNERMEMCRNSEAAIRAAIAKATGSQS